MSGTKLPAMDTGVEWTIGGQAEVTWQVLNNHGGGYSYRLCPADQPLTEACFQAHQLDFVQDQQAIMDRQHNKVMIPGTFVSEGTFPEGSMWAMIPLPTDWLGPRCLPGTNDTNSTANHCLPWEGSNVDGPCEPCPGTAGSDCSRCDNGATPSFEPPCAGCQGSTHKHAIRDVLQVPKELPAGKYVLGWRYDCEATAQVWSNCADVTLVK
eukprot:TRINITY_DN20579_c0_g1_i3.p2 TRINITY_DN20579_c0_g1~~TRINITY_DN20579_c0_g1_i3.p2  ORF type:complete len:210 (-),score=52.90 TRINITY_DN20579_c0_g1_i3:351-980(-)